MRQLRLVEQGSVTRRLIAAAMRSAMVGAMAQGCATAGSQHSHPHEHASVTPRAAAMSTSGTWHCFGHLGSARQAPSTDCFPSKVQCDLAQVEYQVARTGMSCTPAAQAYCTTLATTNSQPVLTFAYTTTTQCFGDVRYCEAHRRDKLGRGTPMSECQLIYGQGTTALPPI